MLVGGSLAQALEMNSNPQGRLFIFLLNTIFFQAMALVFIVVFLHYNKLRWKDAFGFENGDARKWLPLSAGTFLLVLPAVWVLGWLSSRLIEMAGDKPQLQFTVQVLQTRPPLGETLLMAGVTIFLAPVVEELLFRGIIYPTVKQLGYPKTAFFGTAFLFAIFHLNLMTLFPLFVLALVLTWLYEITDNLLAPIVVHALFNAANCITLLWQTELGEFFNKLLKLLPV